MRPVTVLASAFALALPLAGCVAPSDVLPWRTAAGEPVPTAPWTPGSFWTYHATFKSGRSLDVSLVVHEAKPDAYALGTNLSAGFFGLPFNGTVTRAGLNPMIGDEEWRLFDFPLRDGKRWDSTLMGYPISTVARQTTLTLPDGERPGFALESSSYGRTFARYTYAPTVGWFSELALFEPTDGTRVLDVHLTGWGAKFGADYFLERPLATIRHAYPTLDGPDAIRLPLDAKVTAVLTIRGEVGDFAGSLAPPRGAAVLAASVRGTGVAVERATFASTALLYTLDHHGIGKGLLTLELSTLERASGSSESPRAEAPSVPLGSLLRRATLLD